MPAAPAFLNSVKSLARTKEVKKWFSDRVPTHDPQPVGGHRRAFVPV
jgi:hypothetical protein